MNVSPGGQPEVERGIDQRTQFRRAGNLARNGDRRLAGYETLGRMGKLGIMLHERQDLLAQCVGAAGFGKGSLVLIHRKRFQRYGR